MLTNNCVYLCFSLLINLFSNDFNNEAATKTKSTSANVKPTANLEMKVSARNNLVAAVILAKTYISNRIAMTARDSVLCYMFAN